jgi:hypothetical protein
MVVVMVTVVGSGSGGGVPWLAFLFSSFINPTQ